MEDEYPILDKGTVIEWTSSDLEIPDLVRITGLFADTDDTVKLRIEENAPDTEESPRHIELDALHKQLEWRDYEIVSDEYGQREILSTV